MEFADEKRRLYHLAVEQGLDNAHDFSQYTCAPKYLVNKWVKHFFRPPEPMEFPKVPKLVNKFPLGADPEFAFLDSGGRYCHAETLGMNTILPFGCDMAGRQAELRAHSSRFALEVVASLVDALRWIPQFYPTTALQWVAMPYVANDGCGGHVHFGRKRPNRQQEVDILNKAMFLLVHTGTLDNSARQQNTKFGRFSDIRLQSHGYEFRSFPTWMYSPWGAYFVLVISKLMLHHGVAFKPIPEKAKWQLVNLLRLYRSIDDDAAIVLAAWHKLSPPVADETCFRARWGVEQQKEGIPLKPMNSLYFPLSLKPEPRTCVELFESLTAGLPLQKRAPVPMWEPFQLGRDFQSVRVQPHVFEIPNIAQGLVSKYYTVRIEFSNQPNTLVFSGSIARLDEIAIRHAFSSLDVRLIFVEGNNRSLYLEIAVPKSITEERESVKQVRRILADTQLFPICKGEDIYIADWVKWDSPLDMKPEKFYGKIIASVKGQAAPKLAVRQVDEEGF